MTSVLSQDSVIVASDTKLIPKYLQKKTKTKTIQLTSHIIKKFNDSGAAGCKDSHAKIITLSLSLVPLLAVHPQTNSLFLLTRGLQQPQPHMKLGFDLWERNMGASQKFL